MDPSISQSSSYKELWTTFHLSQPSLLPLTFDTHSALLLSSLCLLRCCSWSIQALALLSSWHQFFPSFLSLPIATFPTSWRVEIHSNSLFASTFLSLFDSSGNTVHFPMHLPEWDCEIQIFVVFVAHEAKGSDPTETTDCCFWMVDWCEIQ